MRKGWEHQLLLYSTNSRYRVYDKLHVWRDTAENRPPSLPPRLQARCAVWYPQPSRLAATPTSSILFGLRPGKMRPNTGNNDYISSRRRVETVLLPIRIIEEALCGRRQGCGHCRRANRIATADLLLEGQGGSETLSQIRKCLLHISGGDDVPRFAPRPYPGHGDGPRDQTPIFFVAPHAGETRGRAAVCGMDDPTDLMPALRRCSNSRSASGNVHP